MESFPEIYYGWYTLNAIVPSQSYLELAEMIVLTCIFRVFFPYVNMEEFRYAVELVLSVPVLTLTDEEEKGFIQFYGLPTSKLKCKKAIKLVDFSQYLPQLRYMYKERAEAAKAAGAQGRGVPAKVANASQGVVNRPPVKIPQVAASGSGTPNVPAKQGLPATSALKTFVESQKRPAPVAPPQSQPGAKKAKKRLDNIMSKLWSKNQGTSDGSPHESDAAQNGGEEGKSVESPAEESPATAASPTEGSSVTSETEEVPAVVPSTVSLDPEELKAVGVQGQVTVTEIAPQPAGEEEEQTTSNNEGEEASLAENQITT